MNHPKVLVLRAPGTNCDLETMHAWRLAGADPFAVHMNRLIAEPTLAQQAQVVCIPGGFSFGDDIAAGRILANRLRQHLPDLLHQARDDGKLILGICNGFQVLIQTGLFWGTDDHGQAATLTANDSGKFEDRWTELKTVGDRCVFLKDIDQIYLPVAHAEGKFVSKSASILDALGKSNQLALRYDHLPANRNHLSNGHVSYPDNPNGSEQNVAGICDVTGRVFGLMPHPERFVTKTQHPRWTREELPETGDGLQLFQNAVDFFS